MRFIDKAWYRSFQMGMNIGSRALYWRKPILVSGEGSSKNIAPLLKEHDVSRVMVVTGRHVGKSLAPAILESLKAAGIEYYHSARSRRTPPRPLCSRSAKHTVTITATAFSQSAAARRWTPRRPRPRLSSVRTNR